MFHLLRCTRRLMTAVPIGLWIWKERHVLAGMASFARTVPDRLRLGRGAEVALAAKVNLALLRDERLKGADVRLGAVQGGTVCLEVGPKAEAAGEVARRLVEGVPGVSTVRVENCTTTPAMVSGQGDVDAIADVPVRI